MDQATMIGGPLHKLALAPPKRAHSFVLRCADGRAYTYRRKQDQRFVYQGRSLLNRLYWRLFWALRPMLPRS